MPHLFALRSLYYLFGELRIESNELNESLLAAQIKDDEIFELLDRLAATEEMFKTRVSTIRDVAELTDASPTLIARILGEMRGQDEFEKLHHQVQIHDSRLESVEQKLSNLSQPNRYYRSLDESVRKYKTEKMVKEWTDRPNEKSTGVTLSAWEESTDYYEGKGFYARKKQGLTLSDVFYLVLFAIIAIIWTLHVNGLV